MSNDDGYFSPGITLLAEALRQLGEVTVVAPDRDRSGASNSLTLDRPLTVKRAANGFFFVNGTPLFRGEASYSFDRPRREGLIGFDQARLYLPLKADDNELAVIVTDSFGGWGLMGRFVDEKGATVTIR